MGAASLALPAVMIAIVAAGLAKKVKLFSAFTSGARDGLETAAAVLPALVALVVGVNMLYASGALGAAVRLLEPAARLLGFPPQALSLALIRPISGSGSLAVLDAILREHGPDSFVGKVASVIMGSTETTFYTVAVYYSAAGVVRTRHTLLCALFADLCSFAAAVAAVRLLA